MLDRRNADCASLGRRSRCTAPKRLLIEFVAIMILSTVHVTLTEAATVPETTAMAPSGRFPLVDSRLKWLTVPQVTIHLLCRPRDIKYSNMANVSWKTPTRRGMVLMPLNNGRGLALDVFLRSKARTFLQTGGVERWRSRLELADWLSLRKCF